MNLNPGKVGFTEDCGVWSTVIHCGGLRCSPKVCTRNKIKVD